MSDLPDLYDERLAKIIRVILDSRTDEGTRGAAIHQAHAYLASRDIPPSEVAVVYDRQGRHGFSELASNLREVRRKASEERDRANEAAQRYRERLAELEAALRRVKRTLRGIKGLDRNDARLEMWTEMAEATLSRREHEEPS